LSASARDGRSALWVLGKPPLLGAGAAGVLLFACVRLAAQVDGAAVQSIAAFAEQQRAAHALHAVAIAVQDRGQTWSAGFGFADPASQTAMTPRHAIRAGSISKLFTALCVQRLVDEGRLDLDAPVSSWLPGFEPPGEGPVTLRALLAHRAGLVREPARGHYFDAAPPDLEGTVDSLAAVQRPLATGKASKYSNAGYAVAGRVVEVVAGKPFAAGADQILIRPLGLRDTSFAPDPALRARLARAWMWTYDGREFQAPTFDLGIGPAGNVVTTVEDLVRFAASWFGDGAKSLRAMWQPQFTGAEQGIGLGFFVDRFAGRRRVGHGGAVYGFSTQLWALPDESLAVAVVTTHDFTNAIAERIGEHALGACLDARGRREPPPASRPLARLPASLPVAEAATRIGCYGEGTRVVGELFLRGGDLVLQPRLGLEASVRDGGDGWVLDGRSGTGRERVFRGKQLALQGRLWERRVDAKPADCPAGSRDLLGEYGWDHDVLYVVERHGELALLIEWFYWHPLQPDHGGYRLGEHGLYAHERVEFERAADGTVQAVVVGVVRFPRRRVFPEDGATFKITPQAPIAELRARAAAARPPREAGKQAGRLVDLATLDPTLRFDLRYGTTNNFLGTVFYERPRALLQERAAEALLRAHRRLAEQGYGLLVYDAYRPWSVTKMFWDATPQHLRDFVADPEKGSRHNRGCAVDVGLYERESGRVAEMVSGYDEFTPRALPHYPGGTTLQRWHRDLLRKAMEEQGFSVYEHEWWHFDYAGWRDFAILDERL
jgi:CubicO group peptidase (beta-lactamase class C family)/D-alanyl-D-alanine dipeptidase